MKIEKLSISLEHRLGGAVRAAARRKGAAVSAWLAEAAREKLRAEALTTFLSAWEEEHGALTPGELARAERELGLVGSRHES